MYICEKYKREQKLRIQNIANPFILVRFWAWPPVKLSISTINKDFILFKDWSRDWLSNFIQVSLNLYLTLDLLVELYSHL